VYVPLFVRQKRSQPKDLVTATRRVGIVALLGVLPAALVVGLLAVSVNKSTFLYDYRGDLFSAGQAITASRDPYRPDFLAHKAAAKRAGQTPNARFAVPVYPPPALLAAVPLSLFPYRLSALLFCLGSLASLILALERFGPELVVAHHQVVLEDFVGTVEYCRSVCHFLGVPLSLSQGDYNSFLCLGCGRKHLSLFFEEAYCHTCGSRDKQFLGAVRGIHDYIRHRGKWMGGTVRPCTKLTSTHNSVK